MSELRDDEILAMVCRDIEDKKADTEQAVAEVMRLADRYKAFVGEAMDPARAALESAVRKMAGLTPADSAPASPAAAPEKSAP